MLTGIVSHGIHSSRTGPFSFNHASKGDIVLGELGETPALPPPEPEQTSSSVASAASTSSLPYMFDRLLASPTLNATCVSPSELFQRQLEKLVINASINPLTVVFNCRNGELLDHYESQALMKALVFEAATILQAVVRSSEASFIQDRVQARFAPETLWATVHQTAVIVRQNISSMLQDVRKRAPTEIDYINGYLVYQADKNGIACPLNREVVNMVKARKELGFEGALRHFGLDRTEFG